ncbi:MAG: hypothetical protein EOO24_07290 [Comamonadaceae bacterium]|nr:MAG: hypothetical protein EOO24_07290 [Comamonadaceae bacterium]
MTHDLWPPIGAIRSALGAAPADDGHAPPSPAGEAATLSFVALPNEPAAPAGSNSGDAQDAPALLLPLVELARRRQAVIERAFNARWAPGRLLSVVHEGRLLGVLLDRCVDGQLWHGWMAAAETDWAGPFDVLLEPDDEPFEPSFGLVQTWNTLSLRAAPQLCARVVGEISATRLAAVRAVHDDSAAAVLPAVDPAPGRIGLRTVAGTFTVLSGTPLGTDDPRSAYQAAYREVGLQLSRALQDLPPSAGRTDPLQASSSSSAAATADGPWRRFTRWFRADALVRPAFALLALVVVVQNAGWWGAAGDEEVRFRSAPVGAGASAPVDLVLRFKPGVQLDEARRLLQAASAEVVGGPDPQGAWQLRLVDPARGRERLEASALVESVRLP